MPNLYKVIFNTFYQNDVMKKEKKRNMKKIVIVGLIAFAVFASAGLVNASTTFHAEWTGGSHYYDFQSDDDAQSQFWTGGSHGTYDAKDYDDNPYGYSVDTTDVKIDAHVTSGGYIEHQYDRTDSKTSMYGDPGEQSYTYITTDDTADFKWKTWSNYASLKCCNYGWQANDQIKATGNHFIAHELTNNDEEGAGVYIDADGTTKLTIMGEETWGKSSSFKFGHACGCYSNANVDIAGSGTFDLYANADNSITTEFGVTTDGSLHVGAVFGGGFNFGNFALKGN